MSVIRLIKFNDKFRLIIRNHWTGSFDDRFILKISYNYQGYGLRVYQLGLFNFALCLMHNYDNK